MISRLIILLLIVGCGTEPDNLVLTCQLVKDSNSNVSFHVMEVPDGYAPYTNSICSENLSEEECLENPLNLNKNLGYYFLVY